MSIKIVFMVLFAMLTVFGQTVNLTGSITDTLGNPLQGIIVSLKIAGLKDTTDSLGKFKLTNLPSGNFKSTPMLPLIYSQPILKSGILYFSTNQRTKAVIDVFTLKGQRAETSITQNLASGNYNIPIENFLSQNVAPGFYIARLTLGNNNFVFKVNSNSFSRQSTSKFYKSLNVQGMLKIKTLVDTLVVKAACCFYPYSAPISNLSGTIPVITLKSNGFVIPKTTMTLDSSMIESNATFISDSIITFNFDSLSKFKLTLDTSKVIVFPPTSKFPQGLLRKIIGISNVGKIVTYYTRQASLAEAITKGQFDTTITLIFPDSTASSLQKRMKIKDLNSYVSHQESFSTDFITAGSEKVTADGFIKTLGTIHLSGNIEKNVVNSIVFSGSLTNTASLTISSTLEDSLVKRVKVATLILNTVIVDMGIPVTITPVIDFYVGISGHITSSTSANIQSTNTYSAGITYQKPNWTTQNSSSQQFTATAPTLPQTTASVTGYAEADVTCLIYACAGPQLTATGSLELTSTIPANPWWTLNAELDIGAGVSVSILDVTLLDKTYDLYNQSWPLLEAAPIDFKGSYTGSTVNLTWDAYTGADSFFVYMATSSSLTTKNYLTLPNGQQLKTTLQTLSINNLTIGQTYYFILTAHDKTSKIESFATAPISVTPAIVLPLPPTLIYPLNNSIQSSTVTFVWSKVNNATMYYIQVSPDSLFDYSVFIDSTLTNNDTTITLIMPNNEIDDYAFYWQVQAKNTVGVSNWPRWEVFGDTTTIVVPQ